MAQPCAGFALPLLTFCTAMPGGLDSAAPSGAIVSPSLPVSVADIPQAAALRTAPRIALVIGNDRYPQGHALHLAGGDARAIAESLRARGFELVGGSAHIDTSSAELRRLLATTEAQVRANPGAIVTVFFAGHGFADEGRNYLVPTDASEGAEAASASLSVGDMAHRLSAAGSGLTMMFLDACREYEPGRSGGLVAEAVPDNTFIGFATLFGSVSAEPAGGGGHSYYTAALLRALDAGMDNLEDMHLQVAEYVIEATGSKQSPVYRQGARMPAAPVRLAANDPQTRFALLKNRNGPEGDRLAAECAAMSDLRLMASFSRSVPVAGAAFPVGPRYEPVDLARTENACRSAYASGHREMAVLRGEALAELLMISGRGAKPSTAESDRAYASLAEAAEGGDGVSNFVLAVSQNSPGTALFTLELPLEGVRDRLLSAAERNEAPLTGMVGLLLWHPEGVELRNTIGVSSDREIGLRLFRLGVMNGDPLLQPLAMSMRLKNDPAVANLDLRSALHRALVSRSSVGFYLEGLSVHQTLYFFALLDAGAGTYGPKDLSELVRLTLEAEPFLAEPKYNNVRLLSLIDIACRWNTTASHA